MRSNRLSTAMALATAAAAGLAVSVQSAAHEIKELGQGLSTKEMQGLVGHQNTYRSMKTAKRVGGKKNPAGTKLARRAEEQTVGRAYLK